MNKSDLLIILSKQNIKFDVFKILNSLFNTNVPKNAFKNMVKKTSEPYHVTLPRLKSRI